jgi:hypothetical protein
VPYNKPSEVPDAVPDSKKAQFMEVWNSAYKKAKEDGKSDEEAEKSAFAQAWGVIGKEKKTMKAKKELRFSSGGEFRVSDDGKMLSGYAATWDTWADIGGFRECVRKGAFKDELAARADVRALFNHDPNQVLGRTKAGTLRLEEDEKGLGFEVDLPDTQLGRDIRCLVARGDVSGCSFGFSAVDQRWTDNIEGGQLQTSRELLNVKLFDISPATFPAYTGTEVNVRSMFPDGLPGDVEARFDLEGSELRAKKTKSVDGEDLPASAFLIVGDSEKTETWKLPWKFSSEEKTKSHLRNALARFNQLQDVSKEDKDKAWAKLVRLCKQYGIDVDEGKCVKLDAESAQRIVRLHLLD